MLTDADNLLLRILKSYMNKRIFSQRVFAELPNSRDEIHDKYDPIQNSFFQGITDFFYIFIADF